MLSLVPIFSIRPFGFLLQCEIYPGLLTADVFERDGVRKR
jgi:hypothetical protein